MTRIYEIQEFEAWVRSTLVWFGVREDAIDGLIKDDVYIQHMKKMEARTVSLFEHAFRRNDMPVELSVPEPAKAPKVFELLVRQLTSASVLAEQLSGKSTGLVSLFIDKHQKEIEKKTEEKAVQSPVLAHALQEIVSDLNQSLLEIANNLEKLENAW